MEQRTPERGRETEWAQEEGKEGVATIRNTQEKESFHFLSLSLSPAENSPLLTSHILYSSALTVRGREELNSSIDLNVRSEISGSKRKMLLKPVLPASAQSQCSVNKPVILLHIRAAQYLLITTRLPYLI